SNEAAPRLRLLLVDCSFLHDKLYVFKKPDVHKRVTRNGDDICKPAGLERAKNIRLTEQIRSVGRGRLDGLHGRHAVLYHESKLTAGDVIRTNAGVGPERHFDSRTNRLGEVAAVNLSEIAIMFKKIGRRLMFFGIGLNALLVVNVHVEIGAVLFG